MKTAIVDGKVIQVDDVNFDLFKGAGGKMAQEIVMELRNLSANFSALGLVKAGFEPTAHAKIKQASSILFKAQKGYDQAVNFSVKEQTAASKEKDRVWRAKEAEKAENNRLTKTYTKVRDGAPQDIPKVIQATENTLKNLKRAADNFFRVFGKAKIRAVIGETEKALKLLKQAQTIQLKVR